MKTENNLFKIPEITDRKLKKYDHIKPVVSEGNVKFFLRDCDKRNCSFTWTEKTKKAKHLLKITSIRTLHTYGYHGFFKPSYSEVLAQIPDDLLDKISAFETIGPDNANDLNKHKEELDAGFHVAETILYQTITEEKRIKPGVHTFCNMTIEDRLDYTKAAIDVGSSNEEYQIWEKYFHREKIFNSWQHLNGYTVSVGYFGEHSVNISMMWSLINNEYYLFYRPVSRVISYDLIQKWIKLRFDGIMTDGSNFAQYIKR